MSFLNRRDEAIVPSWPSWSITTGTIGRRSSRCHSTNVADIGSIVSNLPGDWVSPGCRANNIIHVGAFVCAGLVAEKGIAIARSKAIAGTPSHNSVVAAGGEELQRSPANGHVFLTTCQGGERDATKSRVSAINTALVPLKLASARVTDSDVKLAGCVFPERTGTNGRVSSPVVFSLSAVEPMAVLSEAVRYSGARQRQQRCFGCRCSKRALENQWPC